MRTSQRARVLDYIKRFGSISTLEAFKDLGITRLSAKIYDLINIDGVAISKKQEKAKNPLRK